MLFGNWWLDRFPFFDFSIEFTLLLSNLVKDSFTFQLIHQIPHIFLLTHFNEPARVATLNRLIKDVSNEECVFTLMMMMMHLRNYFI